MLYIYNLLLFAKKHTSSYVYHVCERKVLLVCPTLKKYLVLRLTSDVGGFLEDKQRRSCAAAAAAEPW